MYTRLPPEIILQILSPTPPLPTETLLSLSLTNRYFHNLIRPQLYHTISCHIDDDGCRLDDDHFDEDSSRHKSRLRIPLLLRSLLNHSDLVGFIRTIDFGRWNLVYWKAKLLATPRGMKAKLFSGKDIKQVRKLLIEIGFGEEEQEWFFGKFRYGALDASAALVMLLVSKVNKRIAAGVETGIAGRRGLCSLHLNIEQPRSIRVQKPECMWKVLQRLLLPPPTIGEHNINDYGHNISAPNPFPFLSTVHITGKCTPALRYYSYDFNTETIAVPWLFHSSLKNLNVCLLDSQPFRWSTTDLHSPSNINLQSLTLSNVHLETLHTILLATPRLTHLSYTHLCNLEIPEHRWTNVDKLSLALSCVRESLKSLTLRIFYFGDLEYFDIIALGAHCGPRSFQPAPPNSTSSTSTSHYGNLNLTAFPQLRELTTNLPLLLGIEGDYNKISLSDVLPKELQILRLVDEMKSLKGTPWEQKIIKDIICQYMLHSHHCLESGLKRIEFLQERELNSKPRTWPPADCTAGLEQVAGEVGIEIVYENSWEWQKWYGWSIEG